MRLILKHCSHETQRLVQHADVQRDLKTGQALFPIWFVCWQCDECGAITQKPVTAEDVETGNGLPWLDADAYEGRVVERDGDETAWAALSFLNNAVHTFPRNGQTKR